MREKGEIHPPNITLHQAPTRVRFRGKSREIALKCVIITWCGVMGLGHSGSIQFTTIMLFTILVAPLLASAAAVPELIAQDDSVKLVRNVNVPVRLLPHILVHFPITF